jgi:hypothetical protein
VRARDRRALLRGGAVVLAALFVLRVMPWVMRRAVVAEAELRDRAALVAHARADLETTPMLRDSAAALASAVVALAPELLSGSSAAEAMADLSGRMNLAASSSAAKLERVEPLPDSGRAGRLRRVRLRATIEADIRGLVGVLRAVERAKAALAVTEMRIVAVDPSASDRVPEALRAELTVAGWFLVPSGGLDEKVKT